MAAREIVVPGAMPSRDRNGRALPAKLRFYEPNTAFSTPAVIYTDATLTTTHAFPILSDAAGRWPAMWAEQTDAFDVAWSDLANDGPQGQWTDLSPADDAVLASVALAQAAQEAAEAAAELLADATGIPFTSFTFPVGAAGDGVTDDTVILQAHLISGKYLWLGNGKTYRITSSLLRNGANDAGIVGDGTATILMDATAFNNTSLASGSRYGTNAVALNFSGDILTPFTQASRILLRGFRIEYAGDDGRALRGIVARNVDGLIVEDVEIFGLPVGVGICLASVVGNSRVARCHLHDFTDNTDWTASGSVPQITGIEVDNDVINGVASDGIQISDNIIKNLTVGATFLAAHGYQTDGVNIASRNAAHLRIESNRIENVGEGVDHFGCYSTISGNVIINAYTYGLKFIHGAHHNSGAGNVIRKPGLAGVVVAGSNSSGAGDTRRNAFSGLDISDVDPNGVWAANATACISLIDNGGTAGKPKDNLFTGCVLDEGANGKNGWLDSSTGSGNYGEGLHVLVGAGSQRRVYITGGAGSVSLAGSLDVRRTDLV